MGRSRKPTAILELTGAFRRHPERRRARGHEPRPSGPLGDPPRCLNRNERQAWRELERLAPARVLTNADRWLVEIASRLMAKMRKPGGPGLRPGELGILTQCLSRMGLSPADRSKVVVVAENDDTQNPFARLAAEAQARAKPN